MSYSNQYARDNALSEDDRYWDAVHDNADYYRDLERDMQIGGDYCECGQHYDAHDPELHDMRMDARRDDVPHCTSCEENPAAEGDELCLPCAQLRDAQPARQENDDAWSNRGGCSWTPFWQRLEREYRTVCDELDRDSLAEHLASVANHVGAARAILGTSGQPTSASERRMADDELTDALARCGMLIHTLRMAVTAAGLALALSLGSASAAEYTPTAPIGCTITHYWSQDDMSAIAVCAGSYTIHKEAGPVDDWDIPFPSHTITLTDANGGTHEWTILD